MSDGQNFTEHQVSSDNFKSSIYLNIFSKPVDQLNEKRIRNSPVLLTLLHLYTTT